MRRVAPLLVLAAFGCTVPAYAGQPLRPLDASALEVLGISTSLPETPDPTPAQFLSGSSLVPMPVADAPTSRAPMPPQASMAPALATAPSSPDLVQETNVLEPDVLPVAALSLDLAPAPAPTATTRTFDVRPGEMASAVFQRWLDSDDLQLVWQTSRDFRLEAGARFHEPRALDAVRAVSAVLARSHPDFVVRSFANGVVVVMDKN